MNATFSHSEPLSTTLHTFYFLPEKRVHYIAGQFIELYLPHERPDSRGEKRWFTLSSAPHEPLLAITTHIRPTGSSTFKRRLQSLQKGQQVTLSSPLGDFVAPKNPAVPLLFIAVGIGITPYRSILEDLHHTRDIRDIALVHAVHNNEHAVFTSTFTRIGENYKVTVPGNILANLTPTPDHYVYISGPEVLVERLVAQLEEAQIKRSQIYTDFFHNYSELD